MPCAGRLSDIGPPVGPPQKPSIRLTRNLSPVAVLLGLILILGAGLRLAAVHFGLPAVNDSDELMFTLGAIRMLTGPTLNPGWFGHPGTITIYALAVVDVLVFAGAWLVGRFDGPEAFAQAVYADPTWVILPGRLVMVLFSVWALWLTWRLARDLFGPVAGLVAALMMAVSPVQIYWSQVLRSDIMATCFMLLVMLASLRYAREGRRRDMVLAALWLALAVATKWPFALASAAIIGAGVLRARLTGGDVGRQLREVGRGVGGCVLAVAFLLLVSPYLLLDYPTVVRNLLGEAQLHHVGATGGTPVENALWYLRGPLAHSFGLAGYMLAGAGLLLAVRDREARALLLPTVMLMAIVTCLQNLIWDRWVLPVLPILAVCAGLAVARIVAGVAARRRWTRVAVTIALAALLLVPQLSAVAAQTRERLNDTRQIAYRWADRHIPRGSSVLIEHFDFGMAVQPWTIRFPMGDAGCIDAKAMLQGKISYAIIDDARGSRANVDIGTVAPARRESCATDYAIFTSYDRYRAERERFPVETASYEDILRRGRIIASFHPEPGRVGGPIVRIVKADR